MRKAELYSTKFEDLVVGKAIGTGSFGHVTVVVHKPTNLPYALKCMLKARIVGLNQVEHVLAERAVLRQCSHPFIIDLAATFQDEDYVYMLLECASATRVHVAIREPPPPLLCLPGSPPNAGARAHVPQVRTRRRALLHPPIDAVPD